MAIRSGSVNIGKSKRTSVSGPGSGSHRGQGASADPRASQKKGGSISNPKRGRSAKG